MLQQFRQHPACLWNNCSHRFTGKSSRLHVSHVTDHLRRNPSRQCLWKGCYVVMNHLNGLSYHVSTAHGIPTEHTTHTFMQYCYEHNLWAKSERVWTAHLEHHHLKPLNDYCGLIRRGGVVVVAAHCLFCLGNEEKTLHDRFAQYPDTYDLHKHMKTHITQLIALPTVCPHPLCETRNESEAHFWEHANSAHGIPPFGPQRINRKRKSPEKGQENAHEYEHEDAHEGNKVGYAVGRGREDGEFALGREGAEAN
ncbi:hypothetical protein SVAN01_02962 [Stagonosporopsis vannaccii]|nr:hypothetical protein SVAN01_02962 [Stagonosporopsis vannaccii]